MPCSKAMLELATAAAEVVRQTRSTPSLERLNPQMRPFTNPAVVQVFHAYPAHARQQMHELRELILDTAAHTDGVGEIEETLKWGEPAYVTSQTKSGSTVRIDWKKARPDECAMYFHCQTTLIETFRTLFPHAFKFRGDRALLFSIGFASGQGRTGVLRRRRAWLPSAQDQRLTIPFAKADLHLC